MLLKVAVSLLLVAAAVLSWLPIGLDTWRGGETNSAQGADELLARVESARQNPKALSPGLYLAALLNAPLEDYPLSLAGLAAARSGDGRLAGALADVVVRRNPRNVWGRAARADAALAAGDFSRATAEIESLLRLDPANADRYLDALARISLDARGRVAVENTLARKPVWAEGFVRKLAAMPAADRTFIMQLARSAPSAQDAVLARTLQDAGIEEAYFSWLALLPGNQRNVAWPYDGKFQGLPGPQPFNWRLTQEVAELLPGGGLYVRSFGRRSQELASELTLMGAGDFTLSTEMTGSNRPRGAYFRWTIVCEPDKRVLATADINALAENPKRWRTPFSVPAENCGAQTIALTGVSGELPLAANATVVSVAVEGAAR